MPLVNRVRYGAGAGGLKHFSGLRYPQEGSGLGSMLGSLFSRLAPVAKTALKYGTKVAKKAASSELGRTLQQTAIEAAGQVSHFHP